MRAMMTKDDAKMAPGKDGHHKVCLDILKNKVFFSNERLSHDGYQVLLIQSVLSHQRQEIQQLKVAFY